MHPALALDTLGSGPPVKLTSAVPSTPPRLVFTSPSKITVGDTLGCRPGNLISIGGEKGYHRIVEVDGHQFLIRKARWWEVAIAVIRGLNK